MVDSSTVDGPGFWVYYMHTEDFVIDIKAPPTDEQLVAAIRFLEGMRALVKETSGG